jgi:glutathione S-transferase
MISQTSVGRALGEETVRREQGVGAPNVHSKLRLFDDDTTTSTPPTLTLYRDHAGWCPYCQKTMLLVEAKRIPLKIELVNMRSYGDKPNEFLRKVPGGLLPALEVEDGKGVITESAVIMQLLDEWHPPTLGYKQMVPSQQEQSDQYRKYEFLMGLERELFRWWCTLLFRPEETTMGGGRGRSNPLSNLFGGGGGGNDSSSTTTYSSSLRGFLDCFQRVNDALASTNGPYFLDYTVQHPTMIDFVFASHVERMLASVAYWKGIDLRDSQDWPQFAAVQRWMDALERHEYYLAFKSDYYTHIKDIPPQYGPGYDGVAFQDKIQEFQSNILGLDEKSWTLPLQHDDSLQPLYRGPPLPLCVLNAAGITRDNNKDGNDDDGSYLNADPTKIAIACRQMAAWKLTSNGPAISKFSSRGGPKGSKNPRKTFGAELADPYAESDTSILDTVDAVLRVTCMALQDIDASSSVTAAPAAAADVRGIPDSSKYRPLLTKAMNMKKNNGNGGGSATTASSDVNGVINSLAYLRDRVGVPRDLPLASARYLRAYLNWTIDQLSKEL